MPTKKTLDRYGLALDDFNDILKRQGNVCPICNKAPKTGRWVIDHKHIKNWKKLPPEKRKETVRGITCWLCNYILVRRGITPEKLRSAARYLEQYEAQKAKKAS